MTADDTEAVFVDNAYLKKIQYRFGIRVNYHTLSSELVKGEAKRFRTYVYDCPPYQSYPATPDEKDRKASYDSFKYSIERLPRFAFREGRLQMIRDATGRPVLDADGQPTFRQKRVDMAMGIDVAKLAATGKISKCVLVAGDSDFTPAVLSAKEEAVLVHLYYDGKTHIHQELFNACDERTEITKELLEKCRLSRPTV